MTKGELVDPELPDERQPERLLEASIITVPSYPLAHASTAFEPSEVLFPLMHWVEKEYPGVEVGEQIPGIPIRRTRDSLCETRYIMCAGNRELL